MKKVICGEELKEVMFKAINLLCDAVGETLGPSGNNVILNTDDTSAFITNDGVTIASALESEDMDINTVLEIAKEAALKTNELVGDGTTTTLVLLQSIFTLGLEEIRKGINPIVLKKELTDASNYVIEELEKIKRIPSNNELVSIASTSCESQEMGRFLTQVFNKMKSKYAIRLDESNNEDTYYKIKKGYSIECDNISNLYFQNKSEILLNDVYILIIKGYLDNLEQISEVINEALERNKNILILAEDVNETIMHDVLLFYLQEKKNIFLFTVPDYGLRKNAIMNDISLLALASLKNIDYEKVYSEDIGYVKQVIITKEEINILNNNDKMINLINELKQELDLTNDDYEKDFITSRLSKLENGIATIYIGALTKTELKEKKMRVEDALCALDVASNGVVVGEGIVLLDIANKMKGRTVGEKIIKEALQIPFIKIMNNAGEEANDRLKEIHDNKYLKIFNFKTNKLEDINDTEILDPVEVIIVALRNALSIASMLLTTNYLVINESLKSERSIL